MTDNGKSKFNTVETLDDINLITQDDLTAIDLLLKQTADAETERIDFEAIKQRALLGQRKKRSRTHNVWRYAVAFAACFMLCFGAVGIAKKFVHQKDNVTLFNSPSPEVKNSGSPTTDDTPEPFTDSIPASYTRCSYVGTVDNSDSVEASEFLPDELPQYMVRHVDDNLNKSIAAGNDSNGDSKYYECSIEATAPYKLLPGQLGEFTSRDGCVFYWQVSKDRCFVIRVYGFSIDEARDLLNDFVNQIEKS